MYENKGNPHAAAKILQDPKCQVWPSKYMMELVELAMDCLKDFKYRPEMEKVGHCYADICSVYDCSGCILSQIVG